MMEKGIYPYENFHSNEKYERTFDIIRYLIMLKISISYVVSHKYTNIKIDSYDETITMHNVIILIKSVLMKTIITITIKSFLEKCSYK